MLITLDCFVISKFWKTLEIYKFRCASLFEWSSFSGVSLTLLYFVLLCFTVFYILFTSVRADWSRPTSAPISDAPFRRHWVFEGCGARKSRPDRCTRCKIQPGPWDPLGKCDENDMTSIGNIGEVLVLISSILSWGRSSLGLDLAFGFFGEKTWNAPHWSVLIGIVKPQACPWYWKIDHHTANTQTCRTRMCIHIIHNMCTRFCM